MLIKDGSSENVVIITTENVADFDLEQMITSYDQMVLTHLQHKDYRAVEQVLADFCYALLELEEEEQMLVVKTFFVSIVTDLLKTFNRKGRLYPRVLSRAYQLIARIEQWENISEFILSISFFVDTLVEDVIANDILFEGCEYVEEALRLIHQYVTEKTLTVQWIADQLQISTTHLCNVFKLQLGETVSDYIAKIKVAEIAYELIHTNDSLQVIREKYGFMSHSHFIQYFKKHKGVTPLKFKQKMLLETMR